MSARLRVFLSMALACVAMLGRVRAQDVAPLRVAPDAAAVLFDTTQGPTIWARGASYKAGFGPDGAQFIPFLGPKAPRNYAIALELVEARAGAQALEVASDVPPRREGNAIVYDRGSIVEVYELAPDAVEQLFLVGAPPRESELVLRVRCETELEPLGDAGGLRFQGEHGGARYGKATVFDARGRSADAPVVWADGAIEIRVGSDFLAGAAAPLTIDPLITTLSIDASPAQDTHPDVAYDASLDLYAICWERHFSATDHDIHGALLDGSGSVVDEYLVDVSPVALRSPKIAGIDALDRLLVATIRSGPLGRGPIDGRIVDLAGGSPVVGPPTTLLDWSCESLDLGGDPHPSPPQRFALVADDLYLGLWYVDVLILDQDGLLADYFNVDCGDGETFRSPKIAAAARPAPSGQRAWPVLYRGLDGFCDDLGSFRLNADGSTQNWVWVAYDDSEVPEAVGSYLEGATGLQAHVVSWTRPVSGGPDLLFVRAVRGTLLGPVVQIGTDPTIEYAEPAIDSDGSSFVVTYTARRTAGVSEAVFAETYALDGLTLVLTERVRLTLTGGVDGASALVSARSGGGAPQRFLAAWHDLAGEGDIEGALYDTPGPGIRYCTAAPNSVGPGATIHASGSISIELDQFTLSAHGCPPNRPGIFYLGLTQVEVPFGEGFRCIGGATGRITPTLTTDANGSVSLLLDFDQPYGDLVQPESPGINYQFWYRDPAGGPSAFNLSDALHVQHTP